MADLFPPEERVYRFNFSWDWKQLFKIACAIAGYGMLWRSFGLDVAAAFCLLNYAHSK
jgi:hypothetical protein